jgi:hypothetical protein
VNNGDKMTPFDVWQEKNSKAQFQARPVGASVAIPLAAGDGVYLSHCIFVDPEAVVRAMGSPGGENAPVKSSEAEVSSCAMCLRRVLGT